MCIYFYWPDGREKGEGRPITLMKYAEWGKSIGVVAAGMAGELNNSLPGYNRHEILDVLATNVRHCRAPCMYVALGRAGWERSQKDHANIAEMAFGRFV